MTITYLNEVDLPTVDALIESIRGDPDKAQTTWKSEVTWEGALRTAARSRDFEPVAFDEPPTLGGTNTAPNPVEQILGALGSCLVVGYAANASASGILCDPGHCLYRIRCGRPGHRGCAPQGGLDLPGRTHPVQVGPGRCRPRLTISENKEKHHE